MIPVFENVGERFTANAYCLGSLLSAVSKIFEKLVNNTLVGHLEKYDLFPDLQYSFRPSRSTTDLLTFVSSISDRIAMIFNRSWATCVVALEYPKLSTDFWSSSQAQGL